MRRAGGAAALFSWRSPSARPLGLDPATVTDEALIDLMLHEPRLIRRPIVDASGALLIAPNEMSLLAALADHEAGPERSRSG